MTDYAEGKPVADPLPTGASTSARQDTLIEDMEEMVRALVHGRDGSGKLLVSSRQNQWEGRFFEHDPNDVLDITATGTGAVTQSQGTAEFDTGATVGSTIQGEMREAPRYVSGDANYWMFMVRLPTPTGSGKAEIGPSDGTDGYLLRRTSDGVYFVHQKNGVETSVESANWNGREDDLFTRDGAAEAIDFSQANIYVITQLWFGSGPTTLWAIPPDANESGSGAIPLHTFRHPNEDPTTSTQTPNLPLQANVENGDTAESLVLRSGSWATGNTAPRLLPIQSTANSTTTPPTVASPFAGKFVSTIHHPFLEVFLDCDVDGSLFVDFSHDASGVDSTEEFEYDAGDGVSIYPMETRLEFVRVRFEPATDAGSIDLRTGLKSIGGGTPVEKLRMPMTRNTDAVPSKSAMFALDGNQTVAMPGTAAHGVDVDVTRSALPTGAATEARQDDQETTLNAIQSAVEGTLTVTGPLTDTQLRNSPVAVSASSLPLPTGAATAAKQTTQQTSLDAIQKGTLANGTETTVDGTSGGVQLIAANATRKALIVQNTGSANMRVGVSGVTASTGFRVVPGGHITFSAPTVTNAVYAIREGAISTTGFAMEVT